MGFYTERIFPRVVDYALSREKFSRVRRELLREVRGRVLEIGFGTGLNLPFYPHHVTRLTAVDPNPGMRRIAQPRIERAPVKTAFEELSGEVLPFDDASFDSVVSTWTLCSIPDIDQALQEIRRVLKPDGRFFFAEHGLSDRRFIRWCQHTLTPLHSRFADGCRLDRDMKALIERNGFELEHLENYCLPWVPKIGGTMYQGRARIAKEKP